MGHWIDACKEYAAKTGKWCVPKKDSAEYAEIRKIAERLASASAAPPADKEEVKPRPGAKGRAKKVTVAEEAPTIKVVESAPAPAPAEASADAPKPRRPRPGAKGRAGVAEAAPEAPVEKPKRTRKAVVTATRVDGPATLHF